MLALNLKNPLFSPLSLSYTPPRLKTHLANRPMHTLAHRPRSTASLRLGFGMASLACILFLCGCVVVLGQDTQVVFIIILYLVSHFPSLPHATRPEHKTNLQSDPESSGKYL